MPVPVLLAYYHKIVATLTPKWEQFLHYLPYLGGFFIVVILLTIVVRIMQLVRALRIRTTLLLLTPPRETELSATSTTQLFRLLHNLASYRPWYSRLLFPAPTYSFEIVSRKGSGIQYLLRVPIDQAQTVSHTLRGYLPGLQVKETEEYLSPSRTLKPTVNNYGLRTHFAKPLEERADFSLHDPIAYLTNGMTQLGSDELMAIQIVARPISRLHDYSWSREVTKLQGKIYTGQFTHPDKHLDSTVVGSGLNSILQVVGSAAEWIGSAITDVVDHLFGNSFPKPVIATVVAAEQPASESQIQLGNLVKGKLEQPLFLTSVRTLVQVAPKERRSRIQGLASSFASYTSAHLQGIIPLWSVGQPLKRWQFRRRLLGNTAILSPSELAGIYHFPQSATTHTEDLVRSRSPELPAPLPFKQADSNYDNEFATNVYNGVRTPIGLTLEERRRHTYILGATGTGKTTLLSTMIYQDIENGKGVAVVDPHGQLVEGILRTVPHERRKDVVWFAPDDDGYPIALNLLDLPMSDGTLTPSQLQKQKSLVASSIDSIFKKFYDAKYFGPRMENLLRNAILTVLETPNPTLLTVQDLLTKKDFRKHVVENLTNSTLKDFWIYEFEKQGSLQRNQLISPVTNKIGGILSSPLNYNILTQPKSRLDFEDVMNDGKILLCDLSKGKIGEDASSFFGSLIIAKLQLAALRRALIPEAERKDFYLYVDEFQNFATSAFGELVSEARKYRLATILAHQSISQIENRDIIKNILANVGTTITFRTANPEDESFMLPIFSPQVSKHEIANLPLYTCYMKVAVGQPQDAFKAEVNNFSAEGSDETAQAVVDHSRATFATPVEQLYPSNLPIPQPIPRPTSLDYSGIASTDSTIEQLFPLSLTGTEYGGDWQSSQSQTHNHQTLTTKHYDILTLIYRFRFLNRSHLQHLLNLNNPHHLNAWLRTLTQSNYLTRNTTIPQSNNQPAIYALNANAIQALKAAPQIDTASLTKFYREHERSAAFIQRCLLLADINLDLRKRTNKITQYGMYLPSDYSSLKLGKQLSGLAPHVIIVRQKAQQTDLSFIEVVSDLPEKHLKPRLTQLIQAGDSGEWRNDTHISFPALKIVASTPDVLATTQRLIKQITRKLEASQLEIHITTIDQVTKHGITGDIWTTLS